MIELNIPNPDEKMIFLQNLDDENNLIFKKEELVKDIKQYINNKIFDLENKNHEVTNNKDLIEKQYNKIKIKNNKYQEDLTNYLKNDNDYNYKIDPDDNYPINKINEIIEVKDNKILEINNKIENFKRKIKKNKNLLKLYLNSSKLYINNNKCYIFKKDNINDKEIEIYEPNLKVNFDLMNFIIENNLLFFN